MARKRAENPDKFRKRQAEWTAANKDELNRRRRTPEKRKIAADRIRKKNRSPSAKLHNRIKSGVFQALSTKKRGKGGRSWESLVGYTAIDLRAHIERQFLRGMTWENMSEWHIDHILPRAMFNFESPEDDDFKACWAMTNLRPLWAAENIKKSDKRILLI